MRLCRLPVGAALLRAAAVFASRRAPVAWSVAQRVVVRLVCILFFSGIGHAADPELGNIAPQGGQRGTDVVVHFYGGRVGQEPQAVMFYEPGIEAVELKAIDANHFQATLKIAAECQLGIHPVRVRTATGITRVRTFHVGALPEIAETEPNSEFSTPQAIELDCTINGLIKTEDVDYFVVDAKQGERITAEIEGLRLGRTFFDPYVAILNDKRFELATSDDAALLRQDGVASILAPEDGRYIISVRESAFGGNDACTYRLHVGRFPRPLAILPAGGRPGESLDIVWLGDVAGDRPETIIVPTKPARDFGLFARDDHGIAPSPNVFRINGLENVLEVEPNEGFDQATTAKVTAAFGGTIGQPGDVDHFRFSAKKGQVLDVNVFARRIRSPLDPVVHVRKTSGGMKYIAGNDDTGGKPDSYLRFTTPEDGEYDIEVYDHLRAGGPHYAYRLEVSPPIPRVELQIAERSRWVATKIELPRGNRTAFLVNTARRDFGGPLNVTLENLPQGVTVETIPVAADRGQVPIVLAAAVDAPLAGSLSEVIARPGDAGKQVESSFSQRTWLVKGRNNVEVWSHYADRAAVAVTNAVPFSVEIVQPKVPLVQSGSMQLKVVAERAEGFKSPIAVRMLYNPPGTSASRSIQIAEGKTDATIPLTASGGAPVRTWDICVEGQADINGRVLVATPLAKLDVKPPYVAFAFSKGQVEIGQDVDYLIDVEVKTPFEGTAHVALRGLPAGVSAEPVDMTQETEQLAFHIKTTEKAPPGRHKTLLCQFTIVENGEPIAHTIGNGELRVDKPLPPKVETAEKKP